MTLLDKVADKASIDYAPDSWELLDAAMNDYKFCSEAIRFYWDFFPSKRQELFDRLRVMND